MERARLVLAGAGAFGREHLRRLLAMPDVALVGIAETDPEAASAAAAACGGARVGPDVGELIAQLRPDGLIVATPGRTHVTLASAALAQDVPVLVEKPVAMDAAEVGRLAEAERASRGFVLPGHVLRFSPAHRRLREIVAAGEIGAVLSFGSRRHRDDSHARRYPDVDPVLMTMIHDIDLGLWLTGGGLLDLAAERRPPAERRSLTVVTGRGEGGVLWHLANGWTFPSLETPPDRVEIVGDLGSVELSVGEEIRLYGRTARRIDLRAEPPEDALADELRYFVDLLKTSERPELVTMADATRGLAIADAVQAAIASGTLETVR